MMQEGGPPKPLSLVVGSAELPLLRKQTADFAGHRARYGLPVTYEEIPGAEPFHHHGRDDVAEGEDHDADPAVVRADDGLGLSVKTPSLRGELCADKVRIRQDA